ncbi:MAG TPA: patatin-like phospholipase family protein [Puia sp.]|jgi:predicted acylesterase/phospholipase RssA
MDNDSLHPAPLTTPFKKIAMALSGGGYRAATYSTGVMSYLHQLKYADEKSLLDNVEFISSASGGSFASMLYVAYIKKGLSFEDMYDKITGFMEGPTSGQSLLENVANELNDDANWEEGGKTRNLINAFARIYDRDLFDHEQFGVYWTDRPGRTIELCVNATEFYRGLSFRWQTNGEPFGTKGTGLTGNQYIFFDKVFNRDAFETLKQIRLGDIMASSSCFPGGFEPIVYPRDFTYPEMTEERLCGAMTITDYDDKPRQLDTSIGLMDGGVDDNQGLYSALLADKRRRSDKKLGDSNGFDLIMVVDVSSYFMDPYVPPPTVAKGNLRKQNLSRSIKDLHTAFNSLEKALKLTAIVAAAVLCAAVLLLIFSNLRSLMNLGYLLLSPSILALIIVAFISGYKAGKPIFKWLSGAFTAKDQEVVAYLKEEAPSIAGFSDKFILSLMKAFKGARFGVLEQMLKARLGSVLSMVMDINLKQTRRLIFGVFYGDFYGEDTWQHRRLFDVIYELSQFNTTGRARSIEKKFNLEEVPQAAQTDALKTWLKQTQDLLLKGCQKLNAVAEEARTMGTTLWYDEKDSNSQRMKKLIACGQFTTCAKLLEYTLELEMKMKIDAALAGTKSTIEFAQDQLDVFKRVKAQVERDWDAFKQEPYFMYKPRYR